MTVKRTLARKGSQVAIIAPDAKVDDAIARLDNNDVSALVVIGHTGIVGIVTSTDVIRGLRWYGTGAVRMRVETIMTRSVVTCDIGERMRRIYELMTQHQIRHIPITQNGILCGLVTILDVVQHRVDEFEAEANHLRDYVAGAA